MFSGLYNFWSFNTPNKKSIKKSFNKFMDLKYKFDQSKKIWIENLVAFQTDELLGFLTFEDLEIVQKYFKEIMPKSDEYLDLCETGYRIMKLEDKEWDRMYKLLFIFKTLANWYCYGFKEFVFNPIKCIDDYNQTVEKKIVC